MAHDLESKFARWQSKHPNFMTPKFVSLRVISDQLVIEISSGRGITNERIYGVTVFRYRPERGDFDNSEFRDLNKMFYSSDSARKYATKIQLDFLEDFAFDAPSPHMGASLRAHGLRRRPDVRVRQHSRRPR